MLPTPKNDMVVPRQYPPPSSTSPCKIVASQELTEHLPPSLLKRKVIFENQLLEGLAYSS